MHIKYIEVGSGFAGFGSQPGTFGSIVERKNNAADAQKNKKQ
jgi:hypothetical protein